MTLQTTIVALITSMDINSNMVVKRRLTVTRTGKLIIIMTIRTISRTIKRVINKSSDKNTNQKQEQTQSSSKHNHSVVRRINTMIRMTIIANGINCSQNVCVTVMKLIIMVTVAIAIPAIPLMPTYGDYTNNKAEPPRRSRSPASAATRRGSLGHESWFLLLGFPRGLWGKCKTL